jgi:uncharacterized Zn finger protein (UPF0148 family)
LKTKEYFNYFQRRFKKIQEINLPEFLNLSHGSFKKIPYISFQDVFKYDRTLDKMIPSLRDKSEQHLHKLITNFLLYFVEFHNANEIVGNASPSLFMLSDSGMPYFIDFLNGWDNADIFSRIKGFYTDELRFVSPEHLNNKNITIKSDVFAVALFLIYVLSGESYEINEIKNSKIRIPDQLTDYKELIEKMLKPEPEKRISINTVYDAFKMDKFPIEFAYYDVNKIADIHCARCSKPILSTDASKIGNDYFCKNCIDELRNKKPKEKEKKEKVGPSKCYYHFKRDAVYTCSNPECKKPLCEDCAEKIEGKIFCPECAYEERRKIDKEKAKKLREERKAEIERAKQRKKKTEIEEKEPLKQDEEDFFKSIQKQTDNNDFGDISQTITEGLDNSKYIRTEKKGKKNLPFFIIIPVIVILILVMLIAFHKKNYDTKEIKKTHKLFLKAKTISDKVSYGKRLSRLYIKNTNDPEHNEKAILTLDNLLSTGNVSDFDRKDIYTQKIEYLKDQKNYAEIIKLYDIMEKEFRNDTTLYPMILLDKAKFYETINRSKAIKIYNLIMKKYKGTPYGSKAYKARKKLK